MSLIQCPECGHDVSTFAETCPNCGCPTSIMEEIKKDCTVCEILGKRYDLAEVLKLLKKNEKIKAVMLARETTNLGLAESARLVDEIIYNNYHVPAKSEITSNSRVKTDAPKCPTCGSTNLTKISAATRGIDRAFFGRHSPEAKAQFRCNKCGYLW